MILAIVEYEGEYVIFNGFSIDSVILNVNSSILVMIVSATVSTTVNDIVFDMPEPSFVEIVTSEFPILFAYILQSSKITLLLFVEIV